MPELPEVETLCRQLQASIAGEVINAVHIYDPKLAGRENIAGSVIRRIRRRGKIILFVFDHSKSVAVHLRMTGRFLLNSSKEILPHSRLRLELTGKNLDLIDPRRFATVTVEETPVGEDTNDLMGSFRLDEFMLRHARRKVSVKTLLMDAQAVAGIGNIYACEILHAAGILPQTRADGLTRGQWREIFTLGRRILKKAIQKRGTSISDWRDLYGRPGDNQHELKVNGRAGHKCFRCGGTIVRVKHAGRGTYYCGKCQK